MIKVSVVMPCLNMERYIAQSIDSVVNQSLKEIEILIVDAGSTDGTISIIEKYKARDSRIQLIHSEKKSYGYQMNLAINMAKGEYIGIVETDDYIESDAYETLYKEIFQTDADYIKGKGIAFIDQSNFKYKRELLACPDWKTKDRVIVNPKENSELFITDNFIWNGIYKKEYLQKFPFRETKGAAFQDIGVLFQVIANANKIIYLNKPMYYYRQGDLLASSYNHNSLNYVKDEYESLEHFAQTLPDNWKYVYYKKMAYQCLDRFYFMAFENVFWKESEKSIDWLKEKINYAINNNILNANNVFAPNWEKMNIFLKDANSLFQFIQKESEERKNVTLQTMKLMKDYEWIVFGYGISGKNIYNFLHLYNIKVNAFCDNLLEKQGKNFDNISILSPSEAVKNYSNSHFVIANKDHYNEMKKQLIDMGVKAESIYNNNGPQRIFTDFFTFMYLYREIQNGKF